MSKLTAIDFQSVSQDEKDRVLNTQQDFTIKHAPEIEQPKVEPQKEDSVGPLKSIKKFFKDDNRV